MAELVDLEKHRLTINEKLKTLSKQFENNAADSKAATEFMGHLFSLVENLEQQLTLHKATSLLFEKLILAAPRLGKDFEGFKEKCRELEESSGYFPKKES